jgi:glycosyltransferase involved in cell wall biosynthesis
MGFFKFNKSINTIHFISLSCNPVPPVRYGGIELVIAHICESLMILGCHVACYSPGELDIPSVKHFQTLPEPSIHMKEGGIPNSPEHLLQIKRFLQNNLRKGDVVVFNHADHFRYLKKRLGIISFLKANFCEICHWVDAGMMRNIIYPSDHLSRTIRKKGITIPHGEKLLFNKQPVGRENYLFFAGRITKDKGVDIALEAAIKIKIPLYLAGPLNDKLFSDSIISNNNVVYLGELTYAELFDYYCKCKALVYMTQYVEPFGLSIIEAMAAGAPVITTGLGGTGETVIEGKTGFFAKTADDIVEAYHRINELKHSQIIDQAKNYTIDIMAKCYLNYFESM